MKRHLLKIGLSLAIGALVGCGGSGGGSKNSENAINYTGITDQAVMTAASVSAFVEAIVSGGSSTDAISTGPREAQPAVHSLSDYLNGLLTNQILASIKDFILGLTTGTVELTCPGGGTIALHPDINITKGSFTIEGDLTNCQQDMLTGNGELEITGTYSLLELTIDFPINLTLNNLNLQASSGQDMSYSGSIDVADVGVSSGLDVIEDINIRNNSDSLVYRKENFEIIASPATGGLKITLAGNFYHPEFGYAVVVTESALLFEDAEIWPSTGVISLMGAAGSSARITALDPDQYMLEVDSDGDGAYESNTLEVWP